MKLTPIVWIMLRVSQSAPPCWLGDARERAGGAPEARDAVDVVEGMLVAGLQRLRQAVIREDDVPFGIGQVGVRFAALEGGVGDERLVGLRRRPRRGTPSSTYATGDSSSSVATRRLASDHLRTLRSVSALRTRSQSLRIIAPRWRSARSRRPRTRHRAMCGRFARILNVSGRSSMPWFMMPRSRYPDPVASPSRPSVR